jgi:hypothetical protein
VAVIMPPGFRTETKPNGTTIGVDAHGVIIAGGPIIVPTNDPMELVQAHARLNSLVFDHLKQISMGGTQRPIGFFHGTFNGIAFRHIIVPLIGPGYRMGVMVQAPTQRMSESKFQALALELYTRRVVVP